VADDEFLSFAYGSNMLAKRLLRRTPSAIVRAIGYIEGHVLAFDKSSKSGGKGNIRATNDAKDRLYGVVFRIKKAEKAALDKAEGLGYGYGENKFMVVTPEGTIEALAYVGIKLDPALKPFHWYKHLVVAGAIQNKLPPNYIEHLRKVESVPDPEPDRESKREAEAALRDSGIDPDSPA
jgi:gamma-glutamylcyclotransferase